MRYFTEMSPAECRLVAHFGFSDMLESSVGIHPLYRIMCERAFMTNDTTVYASALRVAWSAVLSGTLNRMTPEFDKMITDVLDHSNPV